MINNIEVRSVGPDGAVKALIRLMGVVTGTFSLRVSSRGTKSLFLPGGQWIETDSGWRMWEPLAVLYKGKYINKELKTELFRLSGEWWRRHKLDQEIEEKDLARTSFADRNWVEPVSMYVRPVSYLPLEEARETDREWDAGKAEVVLKKGDFELVASIPVRRRAYGVEAAMPLWIINEADTDRLGRRIENKKYIPRFNFQAGGGYINGLVMGAVTMIWAWRFDVKEPLVNRTGRCASCKYLKYAPEERSLQEKDDPIARRYLCSRTMTYIDEVEAQRNIRNYMKEDDATVYRRMREARFYNGCTEWVGAKGQGDLKSLTFSYSGKHRTADWFLNEDNTLVHHIFKIKEPVITFNAPGFRDNEMPEANVPEVPVVITPLTAKEEDESGKTSA